MKKPILEVKIEYEVRDKDGKIIRKGTIDPSKVKKSNNVNK